MYSLPGAAKEVAF